MAQTQDTTITYTYTATVTMQIPRTIYNLTDPQTIDHAIRCFYGRAHDEMQYSGGCFPFSLLQIVAEAMQDGGAITCDYTNDRGETRARTLFPSSIHLTEDRKIETRAYDTFRRETRSFRLDRMSGAHLLTAPGDVLADVAA
jgi:hypothetical protein